MRDPGHRHLPDPDTNGARRVRDATSWLEEHQLVRVERSRGKVPKCFLLSPLGDGQPYRRPVMTGRYIRVPVEFWRKGWIVTLSGTSIAMWLIVAELQGGRSGPEEVWVSPPEARQRYRLSEDTFMKGIRELEAHHLVKVIKQPQGADQWLYNRLRNSYWLSYDRLEDAPFSDPNPEPEASPAKKGPDAAPGPEKSWSSMD